MMLLSAQVEVLCPRLGPILTYPMSQLCTLTINSFIAFDVQSQDDILQFTFSLFLGYPLYFSVSCSLHCVLFCSLSPHSVSGSLKPYLYMCGLYL